VNLDLFYKTAPVNAIAWSAENRIVYPEDIRDVGSGLRDYGGSIHVIGDRATSVMFYHEIRLTAPPPPPPEPATSAFPECIQTSDDASCIYTETDQGSGGPFQVEVQYGWTGVDTTGTAWDLFVEGRLGTSNAETIGVYFLGSNEVTRTLATCSLALTTDNVYDCGSLTTDQLDGGTPDIVFVDSVQASDPLASSFHLDRVFITRSFTGKSLDVVYEWSGLAAGATSYELRVEGHVTDEPVEVQVFTAPSTWTTRLTFSSSIDATGSHVLTAAEFNGGAPAVRFRDTDSAEAVTSSLRLDRVWIVRSDLTYDFTLQWDWTGVVAPGTSFLELSASRTGDTEDVLAEVYDWQDDTWRAAATISTSTETAFETALGMGCALLIPSDCEISAAGQVRVRFTATGGPDDTETAFVADLGVVRLLDDANALELVYEWALGSNSGEDRLFVEGRRSDENVLVSAWNWGASVWEAIGSVTSTSDGTFQHVLTDGQVSGTYDVRVRFVGSDEGASDDVASDLYLDYVAIVKREYRLDVVDTIAGVVGDGPFLLRLEGHMASSGENVVVYVWDVTLADWTLWLSSPFTTTDQVFERTLSASELSALGEVQIRFVDATTGGDPLASQLLVDLLEVVDQP